jgi:hypothetical protein
MARGSALVGGTEGPWLVSQYGSGGSRPVAIGETWIIWTMGGSLNTGGWWDPDTDAGGLLHGETEVVGDAAWGMYVLQVTRAGMLDFTQGGSGGFLVAHRVTGAQVSVGD